MDAWQTFLQEFRKVTRDELPDCYALRDGASRALHLDTGGVGD